MRKLTIGMATHDDYDGLYFSIQSIRTYHKEILDDIEFVIIDNNPNSKHGEAIRKLLNWIKEPVQYLPFTKYQSTSVKNKIFELADTPYVLCIDSHVLIEPGAIKKLIDFYDNRLDGGNLLQGPLIYDDMVSISTHFNLDVWGDYMWGQWATDERGIDPNNPPFEIPAQGMGLFSCRKDSWLGFNKNFRGFGGEEGYIHKKYIKKGKKTLCLPFLRWVHRFERPNGSSYPNNLEQRFRNYYIGFTELSLNKLLLLKQFKQFANSDYIEKLDDEINALDIT
jgi:hypothetical protein